jgi:hypothetical protein
MGKALDYTKLALICGMFGSDHDGEHANAAAKADQMVKRAGTSFDRILNEVRVATEACEQLLAAVAERDARIAELERAQPDWKPVERVAIGNHNRAAKWLLQMGNDSKIWLSPNEWSILGGCSAWIGPLRPKQQGVVQNIVDRIHKQYGFAPPP